MRQCKHPTCGETCRRVKKEKKTYRLQRQPIKKKPYKLRQYSKKRSRLNTSYAKKSKSFREDHPLCVIHSPNCTHYTQGVHHVRGKATETLLMDERFWLPACNACNTYIEDHSDWAKQNGFKKTKHNIDET